MKLILTKDVQELGKEGETIEVKDGYARNWLIPQGFACIYNKTNLKIYEERKKVAERKLTKEKSKAETVKSRIESLSITVPMEAGENNRLFGSVSPGLISEALKREGYKIDHKFIIIDEPVKELGVYTVKICLHPDVYANLKVWVVSKEEI
ncbi:50S ribosomal protein L9 [candidate division WOR-3 bacterium JGI_Cruoil_03_44_89]|uniref:Large ribosomal subunit protein bL9 n=1 Tax=candidate division WOR-3 bacterium JGI_Cruoil_03_44_89 TaxID=1973748 RepID=A0A235BY61_UNCW3|nr:MAG: 50S ribosomal protein L9 [candidate division WOR-3 bacterium JGI_Cruoil_03_44_89]